MYRNDQQRTTKKRSPIYDDGDDDDGANHHDAFDHDNRVSAVDVHRSTIVMMSATTGTIASTVIDAPTRDSEVDVSAVMAAESDDVDD